MSKQNCEQLTLFPEAFHVSRFPLPGSGEAKQMTVISGQKCCELLTSSDPLSLLAKMLLVSSRWQSKLVTLQWKAEQLIASRVKTTIRHYSHNKSECYSIASCKTFVTSTTPSDFLYFRLVPQAPRIDETGYVLLPTPTASDGLQGGIIGADDTYRTTESGTLRKVNRNGIDGSIGLGRLVQMCSNPTACEWKGRYPNSKQQGLVEEVKLWVETPTAQMSSKGRSEKFREGRTPNPVEFAQMFPTPTTGAPLCGGSGNYEQLKRLVDSGVITEYEKRQMSQQGGGQLNPDWVEWLMGVPRGWTDIDKDIPLLPEYDPNWYDAEPPIPRVATGVNNRVDRLKSLGNMVDPYQFYPVCECIAKILKEMQG